MVDELKNYYDFAENDFQYFMFSYNHGYVANRMASLAQEICEKYLKHIISEYCIPNSEEENSAKTRSLRTHNLVYLLTYIEEKLPDFKIDDSRLRIINGFYFSTRYPGEESFTVTKKDIEYCRDAVNECRDSVVHYINSKEPVIDNNPSSDERVETAQSANEETFSSLPSKPKLKR